MRLVTVEDDPRTVGLQRPPGAVDVHGTKQAVERVMEIANADDPDDRVKLGYYMLEAWRDACERGNMPFDWQWGLVIVIRKARELGRCPKGRPHMNWRSGNMVLPVEWVAEVSEAYLDWIGMPEPPHHVVSEDEVLQYLGDTTLADGAGGFLVDGQHRSAGLKLIKH